LRAEDSPAIALALSPSAIGDKEPGQTSRATRFAEHWQLLRRVVALYGTWLALSLGVGLATRATRSPWVDATAEILAGLLVLGFAMHSRNLAALMRPRIPSRVIARRLLRVASVFVLSLSCYYALLTALGVPLIHYLPIYRAAHWPLWSAFLLISLLPGIIEEIGFRGIIQSALVRITGAREAWLIQAAIFSILHLSPLMFADHFLMGLCLGYLRSRSRSLYPGMALHAAWNALVLMPEIYG
jgi:membrane protease YdiL (CAAX protease family)